MKRGIKNIYSYSNIDGLIPGVRGQRAFPTRSFRESDPFIMLDHIGPQKVGADYFLNGKGHDHPHRGFETITFMFEGKMEHRDSLGNKASLSSGSVQRMNAGAGIIHGGDMASDPLTQRFHEVQLWINNPSSEKMSTPDIHNVSKNEIPVLESGNISLRVITGKLNGINGPLKTKANTQIAHLISTGKGELNLTGFANHSCLMIYVLEGEAIINGTQLDEFHLADFTEEGDNISIKTNSSSQLLIMSGEPIEESVALGGPFVMNTKEEIQQAQVDFSNGLFGSIIE